MIYGGNAMLDRVEEFGLACHDSSSQTVANRTDAMLQDLLCIYLKMV